MNGNELFIQYAQNQEESGMTISDFQLYTTKYCGEIASFILEEKSQSRAKLALKKLLHIGIGYFDTYDGNDFTDVNLEKIRKDFSDPEELTAEDYLTDLATNIVDENYSNCPLDRKYRAILFFRGFISICYYCGFEPVDTFLGSGKAKKKKAEGLKVINKADIDTGNVILNLTEPHITVGYYNNKIYYKFLDSVITFDCEDFVHGFYLLVIHDLFKEDIELNFSTVAKDDMENESIELVTVDGMPFLMYSDWGGSFDYLLDHINQCKE